MKQSLPISKLPFVLLFVLFSGVAFAQQNPTIQLSNPTMRMPLDVQAGRTTVELCGLIPGKVYAAVAMKSVFEQPADFGLSLADLSNQPEQYTKMVRSRKNELRFMASGACETLLVTATTTQQSTAIPMFLSVACQTCEQENNSVKQAAQPDLVNLSVTPAVPAESLIRNTLIGGNCFEVSNITSSGPDSAFGTFTNGNATIGIQNGLVMCTGNVSILPGPNDEIAESGNFNGGFGYNNVQDPDLDKLTLGEQWDVVKLEFDFTPTANMVQFDYVFGSEEYCEYAGLIFNDVFGFFISGPGIVGTKNLAVIPNTTTPVTINNINYFTNEQYYVNNSQSFLDFACLFEGAANLNDIQLDGWTKPFTATANVIPCETYHIKLVLADITDSVVASAVFLRANSFNAGGTAKAEVLYAGGQSTAYEDCPTSYVRFSRDSSDVNLPLAVNFTVSGSATPGVDYAALNSPVIIPAGQNEVLIPVEIFQDQTTEGQESFVLSIDNACSCTQAEVEVRIDDKPPVSILLPGEDEFVCAGQSALISAQGNGGVPPLSYLWNTGDTTTSVLVNTEGNYVIAVTDFCGTSSSDSIFVHILPLPVLNDTILFCQGDSVSIGGVTYTGSGTVLDTLPGMNGGCDTILTYVLELLPRPTMTDTVVFCLGDSITIGGTVYTNSGTVIDTLPGTGGGCDTIITFVLQVLEPPTRTDTLRFCPGSSVTIGGTTYNAPGIVTDTIPAANGNCDTLATYILELLPYPVRPETISLCPGASVAIGGTLYTAPGTATDTIPGLNNGCDTIVHYKLELLPQPTRAETIEFCPGESIQIGGKAYSQPGTVVDTVAAGVGCDTIVTYTLQFLTPAPSVVSIKCAGNIELTSSGPAVVSYGIPVANSDCTCPGIAVQLTDGLTSGSTFPLGSTKVCYLATDSCGNTASCCFTVTLSETKPCDVKTIGCIKYELLSITQDAKFNTTYRIRVTNSCNTELLYAAFELPNGIVAENPANNATYTAPGGQNYTVRNPNFSPFYSIRYTSVGTGISGGAADIFEYTLPPRSFPNYIHVIAKVATQTYYEAYINTFYCPVGKTPAANRDAAATEQLPGLRVSPNPTKGTLFTDLSDWQGETVNLRVFDSRGGLVQRQAVQATSDLLEINLPEGLAEGLYILEVRPENGKKQAVRFILQR